MVLTRITVKTTLVRQSYSTDKDRYRWCKTDFKNVVLAGPSVMKKNSILDGCSTVVLEAGLDVYLWVVWGIDSILY